MSAFIPNSRSAAFLAVALAVLLTGRVCAQTGPIKGNLHVVAVGVNNAIGQPPLKSPSKNAEAQVRFWAAQGGKLYNQVDAAPALTNEKATCRAILARLDRLIETSQAGDTAVVYICAHGGTGGTGPRSNVYVFAAYDGDVHAAELRQRIEALARKGVRVLLILETCHAGAFEIHGDNIIVLAACTADQTTFEYSVNGEVIGVYTQFLLAGLNGAADANKDGVITLAEVNAYVAEQMEKAAPKVCPNCITPANIPLNLKLATVNTPATGSGNGSGTGPIAPPR